MLTKTEFILQYFYEWFYKYNFFYKYIIIFSQFKYRLFEKKKATHIALVLYHFSQKMYATLSYHFS